MNKLELKYSLLELISNVNDSRQLRELHELVVEFINRQNENDWWDELTPEEKLELENAIAESFDKKNWVSQEDAQKKISRWLAN